MSEFDKPIKAKPTFYAYLFYDLMEIAIKDRDWETHAFMYATDT